MGRDIPRAQYLLGHKRLSNTLVYMHLVNLESNEHVFKVARTVDEARALIEAGFELVVDLDG